MKLSTIFRQETLKRHLSNDFYQVTTGRYKGRVGKIESFSEMSVMFYPIEGKYPYRVCLMPSDIEKVKCKSISIDKIEIRESH